MSEGGQAAETKGSVIVLGGGTAGYFAAIALKRRYSGLAVTVVEAPDIPIIGVGEATTTLVPPFLFNDLGIDPVELHERVRPTFKLGIAFDWGPARAPRFGYPFGQTEPLAAATHDGSLLAQSLSAILMEDDRLPMEEGEDGSVRSLLPEVKFGYHLDNAPFVAFLAEHARRVGVKHASAEIVRVDTDAARTRVERLHTGDGRALEADLYVDASGFRSELIGRALGSPFVPFGSSLLCDRAIVGQIPAPDAAIHSYTTAERMDAGWAWDIGVEGSRHRGYVFASAFSSLEAAEAELRRRNPGLGPTWSLSYRSGRHAEAWRGNVVALGNAYGFVEPLESTALHMVILELAWLFAVLGEGAQPTFEVAAETIRRMNGDVAAHWDYLRWFLALHYRLCTRADTPFWRACRSEVDVSGLSPLLEGFRAHGVSADGVQVPLSFDPAFGPNGLMTMVVGLDPDTYRPRSNVPAGPWAERVARQRAYARRAVGHRRGLGLLRARPELLRALLSSSSWCGVSGSEFARVDRQLTMHLPQDPRRGP